MRLHLWALNEYPLDHSPRSIGEGIAREELAVEVVRRLDSLDLADGEQLSDVVGVAPGPIGTPGLTRNASMSTVVWRS
ncbi:hypothetical protein ASG80_17540 [Agromyces sp. Soil535]|nr:hypothetical protein ASG80_17540 [Agromyces sp. Soil535]